MTYALKKNILQTILTMNTACSKTLLHLTTVTSRQYFQLSLQREQKVTQFINRKWAWLLCVQLKSSSSHRTLMTAKPYYY